MDGLAELYPTSIRGSAQGFVYNTGRAASALAPFAIGAIADRRGLGYGLALAVLGAVLLGFAPAVRRERAFRRRVDRWLGEL